jgi:heme iron utilization protein
VSSLPLGKHASGGSATDRPPLPEPSFAERARTLVHLGRIGSLSTLSRQQSGFPFGSVMPYASDGHGRPILLISTIEQRLLTHTVVDRRYA